jgi:DNA transposition AAA+ family ATPase
MKNELKKLIEDRISSKKVSQNELAKELEVSNGTISNILNDRWERLNESMITKLYAKLNTGNKLKLVETHNLQNIFETCDRSRKFKKLVAITGKEGAGKTVALDEYNRRNPNTYKITCINSMKPKQMLLELTRVLGLNYNASIYEMVLKIAEEINKKENPLIIIDEVSAMSQTNLLYLKDIWDMVENNCGIVLCGMDYFLANLEKAVEKSKTGMPEFYSRISYYLKLSEITNEEIQFICKENGIEDFTDFWHSMNFRVLGNLIKNKIENRYEYELQ